LPTGFNYTTVVFHLKAPQHLISLLAYYTRKTLKFDCKCTTPS